MPNMQQQIPRLDAGAIAGAPFEVCPKCGGKIYREAVVFKKISKLLTATQNDTIYPIPVYICDKCGELAPSIKSDPEYAKVLGNMDNFTNNNKLTIN